MPRLVSSRTGVIVNVSDETAAQLGPEWSEGKGKPAADDKPARRKAATS